MRKAVYAGSFDPLTNGHLWMIREGVKLFGHLVVAIGVNPAKKAAFTVDERRAMITESVAGMPGRIVVDAFENKFLVHYARSVKARYILRGIRSEGDFRYENDMRQINADIAPEIATVFLVPPREIAEVSSSMVKGLVGPEGWERLVPRFLPRPVLERFLERFAAPQAGRPRRR